MGIPILAMITHLDEWGNTTSELVHPMLGTPGGALGPINIMALVASLAIASIAWQAWKSRPRVADGQERPTTIPPDDLHPAYAGALASGRITDNQIEATVLELIRKRALEIEPDHEQRDKVQVRILNNSETVNPIEKALMTLLQRRANDGVIDYRTLSRLRNEWGSVRSVLQREMIEAGWLNPSAIQTRLPFVLPGTIGLFIAAATIPGAFIVSSGWPLLGGALAGIVGSAVLVAGNIVPHTTRDGEVTAIPWRGFRSGLIIAREEGQGSLDLDRVFPYAVAMGMAPGFNRYLRRAGQSGYIPSWIGPRPLVQEWPEGWHTYWIAFHTALGPTDPANTTAPSGSPWRRSLTGGRF
jgi:hypothetical protein